MRLANSIGFILGTTCRAMNSLLASHFSSYDLTAEQWVLLSLLGDQKDMNQKLLANKTKKDQSNVTRILDQLERKELIKRVANLEDRRSFIIKTTDKAIFLTEKLAVLEKEVVDIALHGLPEETISLFKQTLLQISENIARYQNNPSRSMESKDK